MTDKEVGELWRERILPNRHAMATEIALIRKLVEVEVAHLAQLQFDGKLSPEFKPLPEVLIKYGIDPETWSQT